jgi:glutaredoxin 3
MPEIRIYTTRWCGYSRRAKALLDERGLGYDEVPLDDEIGFRRRLLDETGGYTVPQVVVDGRPIGGYTELARLDREGRLVELLPAA